MDFHGGNFIGPIFVERVTGLPTWQASFEGRVAYNTQDKYLYYATNIAWERSNNISLLGLDADKLDGYHASELASTHVHALIQNSNDSFYIDSSNHAVLAINAATTLTFASTSLTPAATNTYNLGSATYKFNNMYATTFNGTATKALYADLAEMYKSDNKYPVGTVICVSEDEDVDVTICREECAVNVIGIVSEKPSYLMNSGLEDFEEDFEDGLVGLPVGLVGLLDVFVSGDVKKGDILITDGNGGLRSAVTKEEKLYKVAIANETNTEKGTRLIRCIKA